ncbi:ABC transporter substrate-binding protein SapA [Aliivibrio kagoshimensis]|uniref:ABC transporter substrate-binding protein SapA n=1 Tax=Aliivibrio kagoshimensis TaxID=2910230 RepID=UPI003D09D5CA
MTRLLAIFFSILTLFGCNDTVENAQVKQHGFIYCGLGSPTSFNPQLSQGGLIVDTIGPQIFDRLLEFDPLVHVPRPSLVRRWSVDKEGTTFTFTLRPNIAFQTTEWFTPTRTLNADDVAFSFQRLIDPNHPYHQVNNGYYPWFTGINFFNLVKSVTAISEMEVEFKLYHSDITFLSSLATGFSVIHSAEYGQQLLDNNTPELIDSQPVGTGAFYLDDYQPDDLIRLKKHTAYWKGEPKMDQVVFDISARGTGSLAKLLRDECDVMSSPAASQIPALTQAKHITLHVQTAMNISYIAVNHSNPSLADLRVRQAINFAIDRNNILHTVYYKTGVEAKTILPPTSWAYSEESIQIAFNRQQAQSLLNDAGYQDGLSLTLWVPSISKPYNPSPRKTAELIQSDLAKIGIKVQLVTAETYARLGVQQTKAIDLFLTGWVANTGDPDSFLRPILSCDAKQAALNSAMWCNPEFDKLLDLAREANNMRNRKEIYTEAQQLLNDIMPIVPIAHSAQYQANDHSLQGFTISPFGSNSFYQVSRTE